MQYCRGGKKSKRFSPGSDFAEQIFTGELFGVDSDKVLRQDVTILRNSMLDVKSLNTLMPGVHLKIIHSSANPKTVGFFKYV